jgi:hypothetical protein
MTSNDPTDTPERLTRFLTLLEYPAKQVKATVMDRFPDEKNLAARIDRWREDALNARAAEGLDIPTSEALASEFRIDPKEDEDA